MLSVGQWRSAAATMGSKLLIVADLLLSVSICYGGKACWIAIKTVIRKLTTVRISSHHSHSSNPYTGKWRKLLQASQSKRYRSHIFKPILFNYLLAGYSVEKEGKPTTLKLVKGHLVVSFNVISFIFLLFYF